MKCDQEKQIRNHTAKKRQNVVERAIRAVSKALLSYVLKTSLTANQITLFSGLLGIAGASLLIINSRLYSVLAGICIILYMLFDGIDGDIARAKNMQSRYGQWLDVFFDKLNDLLLIICLTFGVYRTTELWWTMALGICLMGFTFFLQFVMLANYTIFNTAASEKPPDALESDKINRPLKRIAKSVMLHGIMGHSSFLLGISIFAFADALHAGLWFLTVHAFISLLLVVVYTFYRLWKNEQVCVS